MPYRRLIVEEVLEPPLLQIVVVVEPRQVGKTTAALEIVRRAGMPHVFAAADAPLHPGSEWIETQWRLARSRPGDGPVLLVLDEVKRLWNQEHRVGGGVRRLLLGSSAWPLQKGLSESLAGRLFLYPCMHWSLAECREAFGGDLETWLFFGGYTGAASFVSDLFSWKRYLLESLIETGLSRELLQLQTVAKPALAAASLRPAVLVRQCREKCQHPEAGGVEPRPGHCGFRAVPGSCPAPRSLVRAMGGERGGGASAQPSPALAISGALLAEWQRGSGRRHCGCFRADCAGSQVRQAGKSFRAGGVLQERPRKPCLGARYGRDSVGGFFHRTAGDLTGRKGRPSVVPPAKAEEN